MKRLDSDSDFKRYQSLINLSVIDIDRSHHRISIWIRSSLESSHYWHKQTNQIKSNHQFLWFLNPAHQSSFNLSPACRRHLSTSSWTGLIQWPKRSTGWLCRLLAIESNHIISNQNHITLCSTYHITITYHIYNIYNIISSLSSHIIMNQSNHIIYICYISIYLNLSHHTKPYIN